MSFPSGVAGLGGEDLFARVDPTAAPEGGGDIACDLASGAQLFFTRALTGNETLLAPANAPSGATFYLLVDPGGNTLSFDAGYEGPGGELPDVIEETLLAIVAHGARFLVHAVGAGYGDGA